jgi:hypothetical protein
MQLPRVLRFLRDRPEQVSGFKLRAASAGSACEEDEGTINALVHDRFVAALERDEPAILHRAQAVLEREDALAREKAGTGLWAGLKSEDGAGAFSFGFGEEDEEMDDVPW